MPLSLNSLFPFVGCSPTSIPPVWAIACLDRLCIHCWCGQSLVYEQEDD